MNNCTCDQHGDYCIEHPCCACGCPKHAHNDVGCVAGLMSCHGCDGYRPAQLKRFRELGDDQLDVATIDELRLAYRDLRSHRIEEAAALYHKLLRAWHEINPDLARVIGEVNAIQQRIAARVEGLIDLARAYNAKWRAK